MKGWRWNGLVVAVCLVLAAYGCGGGQTPADSPLGTTANDAFEAGQQYRHAGQLEKATQAYTVSLERNPKLLLARYNLALVYQQRDMAGKALPNIEQDLEQDPQLSGAHAVAA